MTLEELIKVRAVIILAEAWHEGFFALPERSGDTECHEDTDRTSNLISNSLAAVEAAIKRKIPK